MEGQSYYYNNKTKNICLINKDLLGLLFKNQKIKNASKILDKSYEDIVKSKDVPFEAVNKNYYKWKVTKTDFIVITLDKSLDETLTFLKIPANNYKQTIEEVNNSNKIDLDNLKQYKKLEDYDTTTNIQLFKGVIDKYFDIVNIPSSEVKTVSNTNNLYETYCILDNTILYTVRFNLNQDNTVSALIVFNTKADLPKCLKDFVKENGNKIEKTFNSWNEFIVFLELLPRDLDDNKGDESLFKQLFQNLKTDKDKVTENMIVELEGKEIILSGKYNFDLTIDEFKKIADIKWVENPNIKDKLRLEVFKDIIIKWKYYSLINNRKVGFYIDKDFNFTISFSYCAFNEFFRDSKGDFDLWSDDWLDIVVSKGNLRTDYKLSDEDLVDDKKIINIYKDCMANFKFNKKLRYELDILSCKESDLDEAIDFINVLLIGWEKSKDRIKVKTVNEFHDACCRIYRKKLLSDIESVDMALFDTSEMTNMNFMFDFNYSTHFYGEEAEPEKEDMCLLKEIKNLRTIDTQNVTSMKYMFSGCHELKELDLSNFDTSKVTNMYGMFSGCRGLISLDLRSFDTHKVIDMRDMFSFCQKLEKLVVSSFYISEKTDVNKYMFSSCDKLSTQDVIKTMKGEAIKLMEEE